MSFTRKFFRRILALKKTLAVAESCSGGLLAHTLTNIPGSSAYFLGGVVAYANAVKIRLLKVRPQTITAYGAVSRQTAIEMATGVKKLFPADYALAITGIAGPGGGSVQKPVGLTYIAIANPRKVICRRYVFKGTRLRVKTQAAMTALKLLDKSLKA